MNRFFFILILFLSSLAANGDQEKHRKYSVGCFNECWKYIDKEQRSPDETMQMVQLANVSLWHWQQREDVTPRNLSVGHWQVSRVYALAGDTAMATLHASKCLEISTKNELSPFYLGYAYEACARAAWVSERLEEAQKHLKKAEASLKAITDKGERALLEKDLAELAKCIRQ